MYADKVCAEVTAGTCAADDTFATTCNQLIPLVSTQHSLHSTLKSPATARNAYWYHCAWHQASSQKLSMHTVGNEHAYGGK